MEKPILDPSLPYTGPIFGGKFEPGKMVRIQGTIPSVAYRFDINLQCGPETSPRDDVAVQLSVHILDGYICLNSLQNGVWGEEQRHLLVPVKRAERFEVILLCDYNQYKVAINGQHYCEFPQRIHYGRISHLSIDGDVSIIQITHESTSLASSNIGILKKADEDDFVMVEDTNARARPTAGSPGFPTQTSSYNNQPLNSYTPTMAGPAPYPPDGTYNAPSYHTTAPYPTGVPGVYSQSPMPPPGAPGVPPPPIGAPIPLNAPSSHFRTVNRKYENRWCFCFGLAVIIAFGMFVMILSGFLVR